MEIGRCTRCGRPFTAGEVTGFGILRTRPARLGGPLVEFGCPGCPAVLRLVPHGQGRYAFPGEPPPPPVPPGSRAPPWVEAPRGGPPAGPGEDADEPSEAERIEIPVPEPPRRPPPPPAEPPPPPDALSVREALEILGLGPEATREELDRAFRERSRTCHPDKVAHLDAEFQALAEEKFRRLKRAYDLLAS